MKHIIPELTDAQTRNLETLATYLETRSYPASWDIAHFAHCPADEHDDSTASPYSYFHKPDPEHRLCNTTACAIGLAPFAGILPAPSDDWHSYAERQLCGNIPAIISSTDANPFTWCFETEWNTVDGTPEGVALRIRYMLAHGIPKNWRQQRLGEAPLCYSPSAAR